MKSDLLFNSKKANNDFIISGAIALVIFVLFLISYLHQSEVDVENFEICINNSKCLQLLIDETQNYLLCNKASNISSCYLTLAFNTNDSNFCQYVSNELSCVISLTLNKSYNYCDSYFNENDKLIRECNFNIDYYLSELE